MSANHERQCKQEVLLLLRRFASLLAGNEARLNKMNVFPLADLDTGTNLLRTAQAMLDGLDDPDDDSPLTTRAMMAALAAARGNSGLIVSQYLAGFLGAVGAGEELTGPVLDGAFSAAATAARLAVGDPVEGTILSVADRVAAVVAAAAAGVREPDAVALAIVAEQAAQVALAATPDQLPVLATAGVVDAGGAGLVLFFRALVEQVEAAQRAEQVEGAEQADGFAPEAVSEPPAGAERSDAPVGEGSAVLPTTRVGAVATLVGFELQFTAQGGADDAAGLRTVLAQRGRDVVVSSASGVIRAHVHLDEAEIGPAIEAALHVIEPRNIVIEPLVETTE